MYQKDYILRLIEEMTKVLAVYLGLMKKEDYERASELIDNAYYNLLKEDAAYFRKIPEDKLTTELMEKHNYSNGHLEILAELFNAEAELCEAKKDKNGNFEYSLKSLRLFRFIDNESRTYSADRINKMTLIEERIRLLSSN